MIRKHPILTSIIIFTILGCQHNTPVPPRPHHAWETVKITGSDASECGEYTLALDREGYLWGWGDKRNVLIGFFVERQSTDAPRRITRYHDWKKVVMGCYSVFGLRSDGSLWGWGTNSGIDSGQIAPGEDAGKFIKPREIKGEQKGKILKKMESTTGKLIAKEIDIL